MDELIFIGVPITREARKILREVDERVCARMTPSEKKAYDIGVANTLNAVETLLEADDEPKLSMPNFEISTEMTIDDINKYFKNE